MKQFPAHFGLRYVPGGVRLCAAMLLLVALFCTGPTLAAPAAVDAGLHHARSAGNPIYQPTTASKGLAVRPAATVPSQQPRLQKGTLLVASQYLSDPNFFEAVVLLVDYGAHGAMGIIINRPTPVSLAGALPAPVPLGSHRHRVYMGGPVSPRQIVLLVRSDRPLTDTAHVFANIFFSASEDTLRQLLSSSNHREGFHAYRGYAGWGPGQLDDEVRRGDWYLVAADSRTLFEADPSEIWHELLRQSAGLWVRNAAGSCQLAATRTVSGRWERGCCSLRPGSSGVKLQAGRTRRQQKS